MPDQVLILDAGIPKCKVQLDPSLTRGTNFPAQLGVTDAHVNVHWFGAVGDGVANDAQPIRDAVAYALAKKRTLWFPPGVYGVAGASATDATACIHIASDAGISVLMDDMATIKPLPSFGIAGSSKVVRIDAPTGAGTGVVRWAGGSFDGSLLPANTTGTDLLSIGPKFKAVSVRGVVFDHGLTAPSGANLGYGGGDSSLYVKEPEQLYITDCAFIGAVDLGVYLSGDFNTARTGRHAVVSGNKFYRCGNAAAVKRLFSKCVLTNNHILECGNGFFSGVADGQTGTGSQLIVTNNTIVKTQGSPVRLTNTTDATVSGNIITDWRRHVSDGTTETAVASGNIGGGIILEGSNRVSITGNILSFQDWVPVVTANKFAVGVSVRASTLGGSKNVIVSGNVIDNLESAYHVDTTSQNVSLLPNEISNVMAASRLGTSSTVLGAYKAGSSAITGYVEIKDPSGVIRKLAII